MKKKDSTSTVLRSESTTIVGTENKPEKKARCLRERFILEEEIGRGGMGIVYRALDLRKQELGDREPYVAIKLISTEIKNYQTSIISLQREAKKAQRLAHPNIATVYDFDRDGEEAFLCMELLEGRPLDEVMKDSVNRGMSFEQAWPIIEGMAKGLAYAHKANIVHCDFKPGNVFITSTGDVKIMDFGIARAFNPGNTVDNKTVFDAGDWNAITPAYASPEMFLRLDPDPRDDIFALGCVSFELLAGYHPYQRQSAATAHSEKLRVPILKSIPSNINATIQRSIAFERSQRTKDIDAFLQGFTNKTRRRTLSYLVSLALIACLVSGAAYWLLHADETRKSLARPLEKTLFWDAKPQAVTAQTQEKIDRLLEVAALHASVGRYITPPTSNAAEAYMAVLQLQPGNPSAKKNIEDIARAVAEKVGALRADKKHAEANTLLSDSLTVMPGQPDLVKLQ